MRRSRWNEAGLIEIPLTIGAVGITLLPVWVAIGAVEELYFRGYLLSRMSNLGVWAPLINVILWAALIHLGQPWDIPAFILGFLPLVYVVW